MDKLAKIFKRYADVGAADDEEEVLRPGAVLWTDSVPGGRTPKLCQDGVTPKGFERKRGNLAKFSLSDTEQALVALHFEVETDDLVEYLTVRCKYALLGRYTNTFRVSVGDSVLLQTGVRMKLDTMFVLRFGESDYVWCVGQQYLPLRPNDPWHNVKIGKPMVLSQEMHVALVSDVAKPLKAFHHCLFEDPQNCYDPSGHGWVNHDNNALFVLSE